MSALQGGRHFRKGVRGQDKTLRTGATPLSIFRFLVHAKLSFWVVVLAVQGEYYVTLAYSWLKACEKLQSPVH